MGLTVVLHRNDSLTTSYIFDRAPAFLYLAPRAHRCDSNIYHMMTSDRDHVDIFTSHTSTHTEFNFSPQTSHFHESRTSDTNRPQLVLHEAAMILTHLAHQDVEERCLPSSGRANDRKDLPSLNDTTHAPQDSCGPSGASHEKCLES